MKIKEGDWVKVRSATQVIQVLDASLVEGVYQDRMGKRHLISNIEEVRSAPEPEKDLKKEIAAFLVKRVGPDPASIRDIIMSLNIKPSGARSALLTMRTTGLVEFDGQSYSIPEKSLDEKILDSLNGCDYTHLNTIAGFSSDDFEFNQAVNFLIETKQVSVRICDTSGRIMLKIKTK